MGKIPATCKSLDNNFIVYTEEICVFTRRPQILSINRAEYSLLQSNYSTEGMARIFVREKGSLMSEIRLWEQLDYVFSKTSRLYLLHTTFGTQSFSPLFTERKKNKIHIYPFWNLARSSIDALDNPFKTQKSRQLWKSGFRVVKIKTNDNIILRNVLPFFALRINVK